MQSSHYLFDPPTTLTILNTPLFPLVTEYVLVWKGGRMTGILFVALIKFASEISGPLEIDMEHQNSPKG